MKNLWPDSFEENTKLSAKSLLEEQAKMLVKLTSGIVYAEVSVLTEVDTIMSQIKNDFSYRFDIRGKFLENYRFNVLKFSHDITLYPVKFQLDEHLASELGVKRSVGGFVAQIVDPEELEPFAARVLQSDRIKNVIGSIIRLSK